MPSRGAAPRQPRRTGAARIRFGENMSDFDYVLFDLGGLLIEVGGVRAMGDLAGIADDREVWRRWLTCRWVREF